jgi:hypothetical protein
MNELIWRKCKLTKKNRYELIIGEVMRYNGKALEDVRICKLVFLFSI